MINYLFHVSVESTSSAIMVVWAMTLTEAKQMLESEFQDSETSPQIRLVESTKNLAFLN